MCIRDRANPVTIYVERSVAKVRVTLDANMGFADNKLALLSLIHILAIANRYFWLKRLLTWEITSG